MSNHFPTPPSTYELVFVQYDASISAAAATLSSFDVAGVEEIGENVNSGIFASQVSGGGPVNPILATQFSFDTVGDAGSFDQDTEEALIASVLDSMAQATATANGVDLATAQSYITISRSWGWQDSSGDYQLTFTDSMTYPS